MKKMLLFLLIMITLTGCTPTPGTIANGNISIAAPNQTAPPTSTPIVSEPELANPDVYNVQLIKQYHNNEYSCCLTTANGANIVINARVDTASVERISKYEYIPRKITDDERTALFKEYFQEKPGELHHNTVGNSDSWHLTSGSEKYMFNYGRGTNSIDEPLFLLRNENVQTNAFDSNMLQNLQDTNISLSDAFAKCSPLLSVLTSNSIYDVDCVRPFPLPNSADSQGFYWITYRRTLDGMPVTANYDLRFFVSSNDVLRVHGTLYDISELSLEHNLISVEDAIESLKKYSALDVAHELYTKDIFPNSISVCRITLEYLVLRSADYSYEITPVWRFEIGENDEQRLMYRDRIIAVNAITGQVIIDRRGTKL